MVDDKTKEFFDRKAGGGGLALIILIAYASLKLVEKGICTNTLYSIAWIFMILICALAVDLFKLTKDSSIYNSLVQIETQSISNEEKVVLIKQQLQLAVDRYNTIFFMANDFTQLITTLREDGKRILNGVISVKELIVILLYTLYDLVIREGALSLTSPWDKGVIFLGLVFIKIIDAQNGFASIIAQMYKEAKNTINHDEALVILTDYIKQLVFLYDRTTCPKNPVNTTTTEINK